MAAKLENSTKEEQRSMIGFCGQKLYQAYSFVSTCMLNMGIILSLIEMCMRGSKFIIVVI
jgi:hypothetical protein